MQQVPDERRASPERLAYEAYQRGDHMFQIDVNLYAVVGHIGIGTTATRTVRADLGDVLGKIEAQGWHLEHVSSSFVPTGSSATKRMLANAGSTETATHGQLVGLYVFRRVESGPPGG